MDEIKKMANEMLDWMSELSEDEVRQVYREMKIPKDVDFIYVSGGTEYTVTSHFNQDAEDDIRCKIQRLLDDDIAADLVA